MVGEIILAALLVVTWAAVRSYTTRTNMEIRMVQQENLKMAKVLVVHRKEIDEIKKSLQSSELERNRLTVQPEKPKIALKRATWKQFRSAAEAEPENPE